MEHLNILGKKIYKYDPKIECSEKEFKNFILNFQRIETLRRICELTSSLNSKGGKTLQFGKTFVIPEILHFFAIHVIKYSTDLVNTQMTDAQLEFALRACWKLSQDQINNTKLTQSELLIKFGYSQFSMQEKRFSSFARNRYIYNNLWNRVPSAADIDISAEIESEIGIPHDFTLFFALALVGNKNGYFWRYDQTEIDDLNARTGLTLSIEAHRRFIDWCSGSYKEITDHTGPISPFVLYPIIDSKFKPNPNKGEVYLNVAPNFIFDKVTEGLYFQLCDRFNKGGSNNAFKTKYGPVFQEYVGELLRYYFDSWEVIPEIRYKKENRNEQDTVDWLVWKDDKLILIEVKQSALSAVSKYNPKEKSIASDMEQNIFKAVEQLNKTNQDILSKKYVELSKFKSVNKFVKLVVIRDTFYFVNYMAKSVFKNKSKRNDYQIININEFETLLSIQQQKENLLEIITKKNVHDNEKDFNEYLYEKFPKADCNIEFLIPHWDAFFKKINLD